MANGAPDTAGAMHGGRKELTVPLIWPLGRGDLDNQDQHMHTPATSATSATFSTTGGFLTSPNAVATKAGLSALVPTGPFADGYQDFNTTDGLASGIRRRHRCAFRRRARCRHVGARTRPRHHGRNRRPDGHHAVRARQYHLDAVHGFEDHLGARLHTDGHTGHTDTPTTQTTTTNADDDSHDVHAATRRRHHRQRRAPPPENPLVSGTDFVKRST